MISSAEMLDIVSEVKAVYEEVWPPTCPSEWEQWGVVCGVRATCDEITAKVEALVSKRLEEMEADYARSNGE